MMDRIGSGQKTRGRLRLDDQRRSSKREPVRAGPSRFRGGLPDWTLDPVELAEAIKTNRFALEALETVRLMR